MPWAYEVSSTKGVSLSGDTASASDHRDRQKTTRKPKKVFGLSCLSKTQHSCQFISGVSSTKDSTIGSSSGVQVLTYTVSTYTLATAL